MISAADENNEPVRMEATGLGSTCREAAVMDGTMRVIASMVTLLMSFTVVHGQAATTPAPQTAEQATPPDPQPFVPQIIRGPEGSNLARIRQVPSFSSPFAQALGLASRTTNDSQLERYFQSTARRRLIKTPEMFGDFLRFPTIGLVDEGGNFIVGQIPHAGGVSGLKIAENNQAITADRVWFSYNHMHDAFRTTDPVTGATQSYSSDRFMLGVESTLDNGRWSLEMRMPFSGEINEANIQAGAIGDMSLIVKRLLVANRCQAKSFGIGIELPTGDSGTLIVQGTELDLDSDTVHLVPFYASTQRIGTRAFRHLFTQLDIPTSKDDLSVGVVGSIADTSSVRAAVTASVDLGMGYWILPPVNNGDSGLAAILEAHYTTRLGNPDAETLAFFTNSVNTQGQSVDDVLNLTVGMHAELNGQWSVRLAEAFPITNDQLFDSEAIFQAIRTF